MLAWARFTSTDSTAPYFTKERSGRMTDREHLESDLGPAGMGLGGEGVMYHRDGLRKSARQTRCRALLRRTE